ADQGLRQLAAEPGRVLRPHARPLLSGLCVSARDTKAGLLDGRGAIVTGGASGIGAATARRFAAEGAAVVVADIQADKGAEVVGEIRADGGRAHFRRTDVTDRDDVRRMVREAGDLLGNL